MPERQFQDEFQRERFRLSVVAFGMFSRNRQWITDVELNADLRALLVRQPSKLIAPGRGRHLALRKSWGRFFFIHEAEATRDDTRLHTYEFLHATSANTPSRDWSPASSSTSPMPPSSPPTVTGQSPQPTPFCVRCYLTCH